MKKILLALLFILPTLVYAQQYHIGDIVYSPTNEPAVVFYVFDDGNHGWATAINDYPTTKYWSVAGGNGTEMIPSICPRITVGNNTVNEYATYLEDVDGWKYVNDFRNYLSSEGNTASLVFLYPAMYAPDFDNGWYMPSAGQMRKLLSSGIQIKSIILFNLHGSWLNPTKYWTSTVANDSCPITINGKNGCLEATYINRGYNIRPIRNFGYVSNNVKDKYYCRGDKINELGYDLYAENDTLLTRTYKSYQGFDSIESINIHVLEPQYEITGNMLVCMNADAEITIVHGEGSYIYTWKDEQNAGSTLGNNVSLALTNVTEPHQYSVTVGQYFEIVNKYCDDNTPFDISVIETDVPISGEGIVCYNSSEILSVPESEGLQYTWYQGATSNIIGTGCNFTTPNLTTSETYNVSVSGGACTGTGSITINVAPEFSVSVSGDNSVCYGGNASLIATPSNTERVDFVWYNTDTEEHVGDNNVLITPNLYFDSQFTVRAIKTSGTTPSSDDINVGDIVTSNNIVVRPSQWATAANHNLEAIGVVYHKSNDSIRVVGLDEYNNISWGSSRTTGQYANNTDDARTKMNGKAMTDLIVANDNSQGNQNYVAALKAREKGESWYLPAAGEMYAVGLNLANVNYGLSVVNGSEIDIYSYYWTITEKNADRAWCAVGAATIDDAKSFQHKVRPVTAMNISDLILFRNSTTCRATDSHNVTVTPQQIANITDTIRLGQTYSYRDSTINFNEVGDFYLQWTFHNDSDCDSVINISLYVKPKIITVTPNDDQNKNCGQNDPVFYEYTLSENINGVTGELSREEGETIGAYAYTLGTLDAGENYELVIAENSPMFEILPLHSTLTISRCNSYAWNGTTYTESGDYTQTFTGVNGCDSVVTLHLTINNSTDTTFIDAVACDHYTWTTLYGNTTYYESGIYPVTYYSTLGCDSIVALRLLITGAVHEDIYAEACNYYEFNGHYYWESGNFQVAHTLSQYGCDSIVTLHLTVSYLPEDTQISISTEPNTLCSGGYNGSIQVTSPINNNYEYSIDGVNFQSSPLFTSLMEGSYTVTVRNGICTKSTETTIETLANRPTVTITPQPASVCEGETISISSQGSSSGSNFIYSWTGPSNFHSSAANVNISDAVMDNAGEYTLTIQNSSTGCNRTESVAIAVNETTYGIDEVSACDSYTWINGTTFTESTNEPTYTLTNANGCDSIVTLHLTISHSTSSTDQATICPSELPYEYHGNIFNEGGTYNVSLTAANGCDSIVAFTLNLYEGFSETINVDVCSYDLPYIYGNNVLTETGTYTYTTPGTPCDSVVIVNLVVHEQPEITVSQSTNGNEITISASGASSYEWENGETTSSITVAASNDTIMLVGYSEYQCSDTIYVAINDLSPINDVMANISVYPVPSNGTLFVEGDNIESIEIVDMVGRIIHKTGTYGSRTELNLNIPSGEYVLRIKVGEMVLQKKILIAK